MARRNLLFPLPRAPHSPSPPFLLLGFSSTGRWASARHPAASEALGRVLSGRGRGPDRGTGNGGWVPAQDWPRALREWMGTGEVSRGGVGKPHGRPLHTTAPPPSRSPRRVGGETCFEARGRGLRAQRSPASLRASAQGVGGAGRSAAKQWLCPAYQRRGANPGLLNPRVSSLAHA